MSTDTPLIDDAIIIGAGAAGLMCALTAGQRGKRVRVLERAQRPGNKILISGGGRCNFTNLHAGPANYLSSQPAFCRSALARYQPRDFIAMVERHGIAYHEKKLGQLFCDHSSRDIVTMLLAECADARVAIDCNVEISNVRRDSAGLFHISANGGAFTSRALVIAAGGLSFPKLSGSDIAYRLARQFGIGIIAPRPGLVPLTFSGETGSLCEELSGVSVSCRASTRMRSAPSFDENLLFTHRGLSGPAILQISSYLSDTDPELFLDLLPDAAPGAPWLAALHASGDYSPVLKVLAQRLPARVAEAFCRPLDPKCPVRQCSGKALRALDTKLRQWPLRPAGTEGYAKAEVTLGGIDTRALHSRTMEARDVAGLYFIGEAVDVTGHLGGFNFQWAWVSGHAAAEAICET
jgi:predicted Rossmann fold flavoprotein